MEEKDKWIQDALNSLDTTSRVSISREIPVTSILASNNKEVKIGKLSTLQKWAIAASVLLLVGLDVKLVRTYHKEVNSHPADAESLVIRYFDYTEQF